MTPDSGCFDPVDPTSCPGAPFWKGFLAGRRQALLLCPAPRAGGVKRERRYPWSIVRPLRGAVHQENGKETRIQDLNGQRPGSLCSLKAKGGRGMAGVLVCLQKVLRPCGLGVSRVQKLGTGTPHCRGIRHCCEAGKEVWGLGFQANPAGALQPRETTGSSQTR